MKHFTTTEVAKILGISPCRVNQLVKLGRIKNEKLGGRYIFTQRDLDRYVKKPVGRQAKNVSMEKPIPVILNPPRG